MSTSSIPERPPVMSRAPAAREYAEDDERGYGWVTFAGVLLMLIGSINFIMGIAAIGNAHFFTANAHYVAGSLSRLPAQAPAPDPRRFAGQSAARSSTT